ncbi:MAG: hypothetical protein ACLFVJ_03480 [Persicimonas sp.]
MITCWGAEQPPVGGLSRLDIVAAVPTDAEAAGVRVDIVGCEDARPVVSRVVSFGAGVERRVGNRPIRLAKPHFTVHEPWSVPPGCYRTRAVPVDLNAAPLEGCTAARTPPMPLGPASRRHLLMVPRCGDAPFDTPSIDDRLNFAPQITKLSQRRLRGPQAGGIELCARARDPEADALAIEWAALDHDGRPVRPPAPHRSEQVGDTLDECIRLTKSNLEVSTTAFDGQRSASRGFVSNESLRLHRHGIATPSRTTKTLRLKRDLSETCPPEDRARVSSWTYWVRRDGELLAAGDDLDALEPGDDLEVELQIDGCGQLPVEITSSERGVHPALTHDRSGGTLERGAHVLAVEIPDTPFDIRLQAGPLPGLVLDSTSPGS